MTTAMKKPAPKGGVLVEEHKAWNTKKYYTFSGHLARTYRRVPKRVKFKSKMVNDANQHLCGGWSYFGYEDESDTIERQLVAGRKPLGSMSDWSRQEADARAKRLRKAGLVAAVSRNKFIDGLWNVEACHDITVGEIGNLGNLLHDYGTEMPAIFGEIRGAIEAAENCRLTAFLGGRWETAHPCVTGLILGYPIENTISLCRE